MAKVNINGHSHQVEVEGQGTPQEIANVAEKLWKSTLQPEQSKDGGGVNFHGERRPSVDFGFDYDTQASSR